MFGRPGWKMWPWLSTVMSRLIASSPINLHCVGIVLQPSRSSLMKRAHPCTLKTLFSYLGTEMKAFNLHTFIPLCSVSAFLISTLEQEVIFNSPPPPPLLHCDQRCARERLGRRWQFIVANRQSRGFTPQVNEWLSTVISPNTDYQMFFKERLWNTYEAILTAPCRICNAIMPLSNKTN